MSAGVRSNSASNRVWAEVRLGTLQKNLQSIHGLLRREGAGQSPKVLAVIKANAYAHGAVPVAKALAEAGADWFGVACVSEGVELRDRGIRQPILLLGGYAPGEEREVIEFGLTPTIVRCQQLGPLEKAAKRSKSRKEKLVSIQLKINTGMNRMGIAPWDIKCFAGALADCTRLKLVGTFTHFASSELLDNGQTEEQMNLFAIALDEMERLRLAPGLRHLANSAALMARPDTWADMVRPGAVLYGCPMRFEPPARQKELEERLQLKQVLSLRSRIVAVRDLPAGASVGYGAKYVTHKPTRIAIVSIGYADGLMRGLSNQGYLLVKGKKAPIVGQISMDMTMIDITKVRDSNVGDVVTIFGDDHGVLQTAGEIAETLGTVVQDVLCALGRRVERIYLPD